MTEQTFQDQAAILAAIEKAFRENKTISNVSLEGDNNSAEIIFTYNGVEWIIRNRDINLADVDQ